MADKKISELTELTTPDGTEELVVNDSGVSKKITQANLFKLGDNVKAKFGASDDLQIYHDGSNSYIKDAGTGGLVIQARDAVTIEDGTSGDNYIYMQRNNKVELFYAGSSKLATTSTGVDVTGSVTCDGANVGGGLLISNSAASYWTLDRDDTDGSLTFTDSYINEAMRIDSSGNVGIGTSSPMAILEVLESGTSVPATLRLTGTNTIAGASCVSEISSEEGSGDTATADTVFSNRTSGDPYATPSEKMRILSSGGITFNGDTAAANALDDYEEGTWTPTVSGSTTAGSYTLSASSRKYTKIGRQVTVECNIDYINTSGAGSGNLIIGGLPFATSGSQIGNVQANSGLDFPTNTVPTWYLSGTTSHFRCNRINKGNMFQIPVPTANTNHIYLRLTATYQTD